MTWLRRNGPSWALPGDSPAADVAACPVRRPQCVPVLKSLAGAKQQREGIAQPRLLLRLRLPSVRSCSMEVSLLHRLLPLLCSGVRCSDGPKIILLESESRHLLSFPLLTSHEPAWSYFADSFFFFGRSSCSGGFVVVGESSGGVAVVMLPAYVHRSSCRRPLRLPHQDFRSIGFLAVSLYVLIPMLLIQEHTSLFNSSCYR
jgi:hypothetical protein